jgi:hypothetical protein
MLEEAARLANVAVFGTLSESYRTCGHESCRCHGDGPKHGPHLHISYRGAEGKTTGYYVPKAAEAPIRDGVAAWNRMLEILRGLAELNGQEALENARSVATRADSPGQRARRSATRGPVGASARAPR